MTYAADDGAWPVCIDQMWGMATDEEVQRYHEQRISRLARREVHVQIIDARKAAAMSQAHRKRWAEFTAEHEAELGRWLVGVAFVGGSPIARAILKAVYGLRPPPYPTEVFDEREPAFQWALARLHASKTARASE